MNEYKQKKANPEFFWFLADKWFRILEFSLILGTLNYFSIKTDFILLKIVYWISLFFLQLLSFELMDYISENFFTGSKSRRNLLNWVISSFIVLAFLLIITVSTQFLIEKQYNQ